MLTSWHLSGNFLKVVTKVPFRLSNELASSLVVKGDGDLIKHIFDRNSRIHTLIMTLFHTNV